MPWHPKIQAARPSLEDLETVDRTRAIERRQPDTNQQSNRPVFIIDHPTVLNSVKGRRLRLRS